MKTLKCEMCGGNQLLKQDGVFVCQNCGTQYTVEEAKKMMIEGTVDVQGTVKVDRSDELSKMYQLAHMAKENNDSESAEKYYSAILEQRPNDWEAAFYKLYFSCKHGTRRELESKTYKFANSLKSIFKLIEASEEEDKLKIYDEVYMESSNFYVYVSDNFLSWSRALSSPESSLEILRKSQECTSYLAIIIGDCYAKYILPYNKEAFIGVLVGTYELARDEKYKGTAIERIKRYKPDYVPPKEETKGGCYVATCVYGSYDCPQVWTLRRYRDDTLGSTWYGRAFIKTYYAISPTLVKWFGKTKWFKKMWKGKLDRMVKNLQDKGVESTPYQDKNW